MKKRPSPSPACPCHSGQPYRVCCRPWHKGQAAPTAVQLMRSRYAAYALNLPDYIMATTHPASPHWQANTAEWRQEVALFSRQTQFTGLTIGAAAEEESWATVAFFAQLVQDGRDASFGEQSLFECVDGRWLYLQPLSKEVTIS
jgi:SEC-C motif domain protein